LLEFKNEMESLMEQLKTKLERKKAKEKYLKETMQFRDSELQKKEVVLRKMTGTAEEAQRQLKLTQLKLRQLQHTTLKDLERKVQQKDRIIVELQGRVVAGGSREQSNSPRIRREMSNPPRVRRDESQGSEIGEVDEVLESTQRKFEGAKRHQSHLPEIKSSYSIRTSMDNKPTVKDSYDQRVKEYFTKVSDPKFKNNSSGMKGVLSGTPILQVGKVRIRLNWPDEDDEDKAGTVRDERISRILEQTEQIERLKYLTPEKQPGKVRVGVVYFEKARRLTMPNKKR